MMRASWAVGAVAAALAIFAGSASADFTPDANSPTYLGSYQIGNRGDYGYPGWVTTADFNGDGLPDLVVANDPQVSTNPSLTVLLRNPDGGFTTAAGMPVGPSGNGVSNFEGGTPVAVGDFNADNKPDLVTASNTGGNAALFLNNGSGGFGAPTLVSLGASTSTGWSFGAGDLNSDGNTDLVALNSSNGTLETLLGNGNGTFGKPTAVTTSPAYTLYSPYSLTVADLTGDGCPDIVIGNDGNSNNSYANTVTVLLNAKNPTTNACTDTFSLATGEPTTGYDVGTGSPSEASVGDFNADGCPDLVVGGGEAISVLLQNKSGSTCQGTFGSPSTTYASQTTTGQIAVGDFGNGHLDAVVGSSGGSGPVSVFFGNGTGTLTAAGTILPNGRDGYAPGVAAADFNGDGKTDLVFADRAGTFGGTYPPGEANVSVWLQQSPLAVGEIRFQGENPNDDYVELVNQLTRYVSLNSCKLRVDAAGKALPWISLGTANLPPHGHVLVADSGYSLGSYATPDFTYNTGSTGSIDGAEVYCKSTLGGGTSAVGLTTAPAAFREGTGLTAPTSIDAQLAYVRHYYASGLMALDSGSNASDYSLVATNGNTESHGAGAIFGAPGPIADSSPQRDAAVTSALVDTTVGANVAPNRIYNSSTHILEYRRKLTNRSSTAICAMRLRITALSTYGDTTSGNLSVLSSNSEAFTSGSDGSQTAEGLTLDSPPSGSSAGGLNSSLTVPASEFPDATACPGSTPGLSAGSSMYVNIWFYVNHGGPATWSYDVEDLH